MMRNKNLKFSLLTIGILLFLIVGLTAKEHPSYMPQTLSFAKTSQTRVTRVLSNINNWSYWQLLGGRSGNDPAGNSGGIYPRGTAGVVFTDGLVWGTIVNGKIQVGGVTYNVGTQAGWVTESGSNPQAIDPEDARVMFYKIRSDWRTLTGTQVRQEAAEINQISVDDVTDAQTATIIQQYKEAWINWPVDLGAPFVDQNGNGIYEPVLDDDGAATTDGDYPGIAQADQIIWYVNNDLDASRVSFLYGSDPIGVELQVTMWGYNQPGARLGQIIFKKYTFINKSDDLFDSMYVAQWCDPDLGNYSDDVVGCDSLLGLGFVWNSAATDVDFELFGLAPPAGGYDFFQGPLVEGRAGEDLNLNEVDDAEDYGIFNLKQVGPGLINLPMTSFGYFSAGNEEWEDPDLQVYDGTLQWYNLLRGNITNVYVDDPTPFTHRSTGQPTLWPLNGDPVTGVGDIDGEGANFSAADRRMSLNCGPFIMQPGDTQEVVVALIGGSSDDHKGSITQLKITDQVAQDVYDDLFRSIPKAPQGPNVRVTPFEDQIVLDWSWDQKTIDATEKSEIAGYAFEGYNIYQLPSATAGKDQAVRVATFDLVNDVKVIEGKVFDPRYGQEVIVPVQFGKDGGIQRYFVVDKNYLTGEALFPGTTYYFSVTAYNYNEAPELIEDKALESSLLAEVVRSQSEMPGVRYLDPVASELEIDDSQNTSDGQVQVLVVDPSKTTGDTYEVFFEEDTDTNSATYGEVLWSVKNSAGNVKVSRRSIEADLTASDQPVFDGVQVKVSGPAKTFKSIVETAWEGTPVSPPDNVWHSLNSTRDYYISGGGGDGSLSRLERWVDYAVPRDFELRFTEAGGYGIYAFTDDKICTTPFEIWDVTNNLQMIPFINDDPAGTLDNWTTSYGTYTDPYFGYPASHWIYWMDPEPGTDGYDGFASVCDQSGGAGAEYNFDLDTSTDGYYANFYGGFVYPIGRLIIGDYAEDGTPPPAGTTIKLITTKPSTPNDKFFFTTAGTTADKTTAEQDVANRITVYPNPYYAYNPQEPDRFTRFITFYHLPPRQATPEAPYASKTTIRIFDLSGALVRTLEKEEGDNSQFLRWDLRNEAELPVASGVYIAHIDMPDLGQEKVLKIFIVQPAQIIRFY